ncbi:MAG: hypothetical protein M1814_000900 [Vezdaea aestivalis]|nr:MAG: hypothetical protein M1814_000900 [Vezdaea aestivalis]
MASQRERDSAIEDALSSEPEEWQNVLNRVRTGVCQIHGSFPRSHSVVEPVSFQGTGFLVSEEKGLVLTNQHLAGPGPFAGIAIFENNTEFNVTVEYVDCEQDFAFLRLHRCNASYHGLKAIPLEPTAAQKGVAVRLVGNDSAMKITIGQAVISRLDVSAPLLPGNEITVLNTEYISAAFSARGGSSGSPVVNIKGQAVALQSILQKNIALLMPLFYPQKVLRLLEKGLPVYRGTLRIHWELKPLNECQRSRLPSTWDKKIRKDARINAIVARTIVPEGPAERKIEPDDILLELDDKLATDLWKVSEYMDTHIDKEVKMKVWRFDREVNVVCRVGDLHRITPHYFLHYAGAIFHILSWQLAVSNKCSPVNGIYITGYPESKIFTPGMILLSINNEPVSTLDALSAVLGRYRGGAHVTTAQRRLNDPTNPKITTGYLPPDYTEGPKSMIRNPVYGGKWTICDELLKVPAPTGSTSDGSLTRNVSSTTGDPTRRNGIFPNMVFWECYTVARLAGSEGGRVNGVGLLVHPGQGLVVANRGKMGLLTEVILTVGGISHIKGSIIFLHETVDLMLLQFQPSSELSILPAIRLSDRIVKDGDEVNYAYFHRAEEKSISAKIDLVSECYRQKSSGISPFFGEQIRLDSPASSTTHSFGVIMFKDDTVAGLKLANYFLPASRIETVLSFKTAGSLGDVRYQDFDVIPIPLSDACERGLSASSSNYVMAHPSARRQLLEVSSVPSTCVGRDGEIAQHPLRKGDLILELNGKPVIQSLDLDHISLQSSMSVLVFRQGIETLLHVPTVHNSQLQITEVVRFCGGSFQKPSLQIRMDSHPMPSEVYLSYVDLGSPAQSYRLPSNCFICTIDKKPIFTMEEFKAAIGSIPDDMYFTVKVSVSNRLRTVSLKKNSIFFPSFSRIVTGNKVMDETIVFGKKQ